MQKQKNKERGITLIALVVTIIVLIILAGVSINMLVGENGIINMAQRAKEGTTNATITSEEQMNVLVDEMNQKLPEGIEEGTTNISINDLKVGDYIEYDSGTNGVITCRVLYPASSQYGLQIISNESVETVTLGEDNNFEISRTSYNNAIETLNNEAEKYINLDYSTDARCVGSISTTLNGKFINKDVGTSSTVTLPPSSWNSYIRPDNWKDDDTECFDTDNNYLMDQEQMKNAEILITEDYYWLASHTVASGVSGCVFSVRYIDPTGNLLDTYICGVNNTGDTNGYSRLNGIRPCILLRNDIKIIGGDGQTEETAYTIGI